MISSQCFQPLGYAMQNKIGKALKYLRWSIFQKLFKTFGG